MGQAFLLGGGRQYVQAVSQSHILMVSDHKRIGEACQAHFYVRANAAVQINKNATLIAIQRRQKISKQMIRLERNDCCRNDPNDRGYRNVAPARA